MHGEAHVAAAAGETNLYEGKFYYFMLSLHLSCPFFTILKVVHHCMFWISVFCGSCYHTFSLSFYCCCLKKVDFALK